MPFVERDNFSISQLFESIGKAITSHGEDLEKAMAGVLEKLKLLEDGIEDFFLEGTPSINQGNLGLLDILMVAILGPYRAQGIVLGLKILDPERSPLVYSWVRALNELPVVKETTSAYEKLISILQFIKENHIKLVAN